MSSPINDARALLASRDETAKFAGYPDRKLADAMRELLREVERIRAEDARCLDAADAATREDERRHAEVVKAAMERERLLREERDEARAGQDRLIRAITGGQPADADRLHAICRAEVLRRAEAECNELRTATRRLRAMLAVPAAEYVPAMADALMLLQDLDPTDANKETPDAN